MFFHFEILVLKDFKVSRSTITKKVASWAFERIREVSARYFFFGVSFAVSSVTNFSMLAREICGEEISIFGPNRKLTEGD